MELRGRIVGPRCLYAETVEVAYPFRPPDPRLDLSGIPLSALMPPGSTEFIGNLIRQIIIPEPSLWDPVSPFLYQVVAELWQEGKRCDQTQIRHGLRTLQLGRHGLRWNGHPLTLRGTERVPRTEAEAVALRKAGYNLLIAPLQRNLWSLADRVGLLVLVRLSGTKEEVFRAVELLEHPCCFGFLLGPDALWNESLYFVRNDRRALIGKELEKVPPTRLPDAVSFVVCRDDMLGELADIGLPKLLRARGGRGLNPAPSIEGHPPHTLGWLAD